MREMEQASGALEGAWQGTGAAGEPAESILRMLGEPLWMTGRAVQPVASRKGLALLCYLACQPGVQTSRRHLGSLLWGDFDRGQAGASLATTLSRLRRQVSRWPLASHGDYLCWESALGVATDVGRFRDGLHRGAPAASVAGLIGGPFLTGLEFDDAPLYMEWLLAERQAWHRRSLDVLWAAALESRARGEWGQVLAWGRQALALDALQERFVRTVMVAHAALGDRTACAAAYEALASRLARQLDALPDADTTRLRDTLLRGASRVRPDDTGALGRAARAERPAPALVGRAAERQQLQALLQQGKAATALVGPMGVGKTRLLRAVADLVDHAWADGRAWVDAGSPLDEAFPWDAWARELQVPEPSWRIERDAPWRALAAGVPAGREPLLVLDHAEDLPGPRLVRLLQAAAQRGAGPLRLLVALDAERLEGPAARAWRGLAAAGEVALVPVEPLPPSDAALLAAAASDAPDPPIGAAAGFPLLILAEVGGPAERAALRGRVAEWLASWPLPVRAILEMAALAPAGLPVARLWGGGPAALDALDRVVATGWLVEVHAGDALQLAWRAPALARLIREAMSPTRQAYWTAQLAGSDPP